MSVRASLPLAAAGALALVVLPSLPAAAAVDTQTWISPSHEAWSHASTWSTNEVPENGDTLVFSGPGAAAMSDNNLGAILLAGMQFDTSHNVSFSNGNIGTGAGGIQVTAGDVRINSDLRPIGAQTWTVAAGATATFPGVIRTDGVSALTLDVEGTMVVAGDIDALATGPVIKTGSGTIIRTGGAGGGIGNGGLDVQEGVFELEGALIGGTAFQVTGGTLSGGGRLNALTLTDGVVAPGPDAGVGTGMLTTGNATLTGGVFQVTVDETTNSNDALYVPGATLVVDGTTLEVVTVGTPTPGDTAEIAGTDAGGVIDPASRFRSPAGDVLQDGDEFVTGGHVYRIGYDFTQLKVITVEYVGLAPVPPAPAAALPDTGVEFWVALALASGLLTSGAVLVVRRRIA